MARKASRKKAKLRLALAGPSGSGKTISALRIAYGISGDWNKIGLVDTENESADLYANHALADGFVVGEFWVEPVKAPFTIEKYKKAIEVLQKEGCDIIIVDTISHEWAGSGGVLEAVDTVTQSTSSKNAFSSGWKEMGPKHNSFIEFLLQCPHHLIVTIRSKQDYILADENGKKVPKKVGLGPVQREGVEYEFTTYLDMSMNHHAIPSKDRTGLFSESIPFIPTENTGAMLRDWCESGIDIVQETKEAITKLTNCNTVDELMAFKDLLPAYVINDEGFKAAGNNRYNEIRPKTV